MTASTRRLMMETCPGLEGDARFIQAEGDRMLLHRAREGDHKACRELLGRYGQRLLNVVNATHADLGIAEDVVQEAFIRALAQADQLREETSMFPWLVRIALRVGFDYRRKVRREMLTNVFQDVPAAKEMGPEHRAASSEDSLRVRSALGRLKPYPRQLIVLRYFANLSIAELALVFAKSESAVRKDLQRARERVKRLIGEWFEA